MPRLRKVEKTWIEDDLPIAGELTNCRQLSDDEWQGADDRR
jgi:hypothetical protein